MAWIWGGETGEQKGRIRLGRVDGFKEVLTILSSAAGPLWGGRDADGDDGGRLGGGSEAVSGLPLAAGRQGPQRPQVPRGAALFHGPQRYLAGAPCRVRQLEQHLETVLAAEPSGCLRGLVRGARREQPDRPSRADVRLHHRSGSCLSRRRPPGRRKRMARPVRKWLGSAGLNSLRKRIRPSGCPLAKMEIRASRSS